MDILQSILVVAVIFIPLELLLPQRPAQRIFRRHWFNDLIYLFGNGFVVRIGVLLAFAFLLGGVETAMPGSARGFVQSQPIWLQVVAALMVAEIGFYAAHRLFHAVPYLWRFHAIHHSIEDLDWLAAHRVHPVDQVFSSLATVVPLLVIGFSPEAMAIYGLLYLLQSHLVHANVRLDFGPLRWVFASPRFHHWHHANQPEAHGHNFSAQLVFMDQIFGTLRIPDAMPDRYGTDEAIPQVYPLQMAWPFLRHQPARAPQPLTGSTPP